MVEALENEVVAVFHRFNSAQVANTSDSQVSEYWQIYSRDKEVTAATIKSFRERGGLADGLNDEVSIASGKGIFVDLINSYGYERTSYYLCRDNVGNDPNAFNIGAMSITANDLVQLEWLLELAPELDVKLPPLVSVFEFGSGYGSFARLIAKFIAESKRKAKYTIVELPISACLSAYYLASQREFSVVYNGMQLTKIESPVEFVVCDVDYFEKEKNQLDSFDFVVNTRSLMEMEKSTVNEYFGLIQRHLRVGGLFLNINRLAKTSYGLQFEFKHLPYDSFWSILHSSFAKRQKHQVVVLARRESQPIDDWRSWCIGLGSMSYQTREDSLTAYRIAKYFAAFLRRFTPYSVRHGLLDGLRKGEGNG